MCYGTTHWPNPWFSTKEYTWPGRCPKTTTRNWTNTRSSVRITNRWSIIQSCRWDREIAAQKDCNDLGHCEQRSGVVRSQRNAKHLSDGIRHLLQSSKSNSMPTGNQKKHPTASEISTAPLYTFTIVGDRVKHGAYDFTVTAMAFGPTLFK